MRLDNTEYAYSVEFMCGRLGVSTSGYCNWRNRTDSATAQRRGTLRLLVKKVFDMSDGTYGYRRVHAQLRRWGHAAGPELVRRLMRELGLVPCQPKPKPKRWWLTQLAPGPAPDLVGRDVTADAPGEKLVGDITYVPTGEGWLYLATVIDCYTKEVIGYAMDDHCRTPLISRAIRNVARNRKLPEGAIFLHSAVGYRPPREVHAAFEELRLAVWIQLVTTLSEKYEAPQFVRPIFPVSPEPCQHLHPDRPGSAGFM